MQQKRVLRIVVASPGDVQAERAAIPGVLDELNRGIAADRNLLLELSRWETDAHPGAHPDGPQELIDPILRIEDCDVLIGIFWKRFGTPTKDAPSGTAHEIFEAYRAWQQHRRPQLMIYFNQQAHTPQSTEELEQWGQVLKFKQDFPREVLSWNYTGEAEFEKLLRGHLTQFIRNLPRASAAQPATKTEPAHADGGEPEATAVPTSPQPSPGGGAAGPQTSSKKRALQQLVASKKKLYAALAALVAVVALGGAFAYSIFKPEPPLELGELTNTELDDEFLNLNKWTPPPTGWSIDPNEGKGRLVVENQPQVGCAVRAVYGDFEMSFHLKLLNDGGAAWALRADQSGLNYYLFYLSGPTGNLPNRFVTYVVRNGAIDLTTERTQEINNIHLAGGTRYRVLVKAVGNKINHVIVPQLTGQDVPLREFEDEKNVLPRGRICFRTVGAEKFSIDDLLAEPLTAQPAQ